MSIECLSLFWVQFLFSGLESGSGMEPCHLEGVCLCLCGLTSRLTHRLRHSDLASANHFTFNGVCVCVCNTLSVSEWLLLHRTHCTVYTDIRIGKHGQSGLTTAAAVADLTNQSCRRESHDLEQLTQDMLVCLQSTEMSVHHYCSQLVAVVAAHIGGGLTRAGVREGEEGGEGGEGGTAEMKVTASINACLKLLASLVELFEVHLHTLLRLFHHSSSFP